MFQGYDRVSNTIIKEGVKLMICAHLNGFFAIKLFINSQALLKVI